MNLRQITIKDQLELKKVYFDSIQSLDEKIYSQEQKRAWSSQAWNNPNFNKSIIKGKGWLISKKGIIIAFATRYPDDRIALFYCKGKFQRKGYGSKLLHKLEDEAKKEGLDSLYTEASLISFELFLKNEWEIIRKEKVIINNIFFERYKMTKIIKNYLIFLYFIIIFFIFSLFPFKKTFLYFLKFLIFSLSGPAGIVKLLPIQLSILKQAIL